MCERIIDVLQALVVRLFKLGVGEQGGTFSFVTHAKTKEIGSPSKRPENTHTMATPVKPVKYLRTIMASRGGPVVTVALLVTAAMACVSLVKGEDAQIKVLSGK